MKTNKTKAAEPVVDGVHDSDDLEALFESVSAERKQAAPRSAAAKTAVPAAVAAAAAAAAAAAVPVHQPEDCPADKVIDRVGKLTRSLHESLRELGLDQALQNAATVIPDTRERLSYIATMTAQAANRVLTATEAAKPIQDEIESGAGALGREWERLYAGELDVDAFRRLAGDTRTFLNELPARTAATNAHLLEIMMAQDFQDLTGQVIKKIMDVAQNMEQQLLQLLVENASPDKLGDAASNLLNGPMATSRDAVDSITSQAQVDELLESLGF